MKLGIIGNGDSARSFAGASHFVQGVELFGIAGRNPDRVKPLTEKFGGAPMSIEELSLADIDCVAVSTPPGLRVAHALPFLKRGVHAMIEKPMALCVEDCDRMIEAAGRSGARIMVTQTHRYNPFGRKAFELVDSGRFGEVVSVRVYSGHDYFGSKRTGWQLDPALSGGGVTFNPFIHMVDFARFMARSKVKWFRGTIGRHKEGYDIEGDVHCLLAFENGATGVVEVDGYGHLPGHWIEVVMRDAAMRVLPREKRIEIVMADRIAETYGFGENGTKNEHGIYGHWGYINHIAEMREAIEEGGPILSDGANGRANVAIAYGILEQNGAPELAEIRKSKPEIRNKF